MSNASDSQSKSLSFAGDSPVSSFSSPFIFPSPPSSQPPSSKAIAFSQQPATASSFEKTASQSKPVTSMRISMKAVSSFFNVVHLVAPLAIEPLATMFPIEATPLSATSSSSSPYTSSGLPPITPPPPADPPRSNNPTLKPAKHPEEPQFGLIELA
ncbi:putative protein TPRXL [Benincasa hispida]|uniref:putative protein TPRXL n=1 Tax=Benincasa hispida TaxID=102211 RepID=UPI0018FFA7AD|nr:putative protein TPRXL [Benincasa hispida]